LATLQQTRPVVQEGLLSYEVGTKLTLMDRTLQFNGAAFYYDYTNKQILGAVSDVLFGALPSLVNVPKSRVMGFELSANYTPDWLEGLSLRPAVSFQDSKIQTSGKNTCLPPPAAIGSRGARIRRLSGRSLLQLRRLQRIRRFHRPAVPPGAEVAGLGRRRSTGGS
jgi:outer membrane receptor protein involved in Fe transport